MNAAVRGVTARPGWTIAVVLTVTVFWLTRLVDLSADPPALVLDFDPSVNRMMSAEDDSRLFYDLARRVFGDDDMIIVAVHSRNLFTPPVMHRLKRIHDRIAALDGVERVVSLFTALDIRADGRDLVIEPFLEDVPAEAEALAGVRRRVLANPVYAGNLVASGGDSTALFLHLRDVPESKLIRSGLDERIRAIADEERGDADVWVSGAAYVKIAGSRLLASDFKRAIPLGLAFLVLVALLAFRSVRGVVVPLVSIGLANVWMLGTMAWLGYPLNLVTAAIPALVQTIGFAYAIHIVSEYYDHLRAHGPHAVGGLNAAGHALDRLKLPLFLTGFTTAAGLASLTLSPMTAVREFGVLAVCGVVYTMILAGTFVPAALSLGTAPAAGGGLADHVFGRAAARLAAFDVRHRRALLVCCAVLFAVAVLGIPRIRVSTGFVSNFAPDHRVRRDFEAVGTFLGGGDAFSVVLQAGSSDAFKNPVNLRAVESLQHWLEEQPEIGNTISLADYIRLIHWGFQRNDPAQLRIPDSSSLIAKLLLFGGSAEIPRFVNPSYSMSRILVRFRTLDSGELSALLQRVEDHLAELPGSLEGRVTGATALLAWAMDGISIGQIRSLSLAFAIIYLVLAGFFGSFRLGAWALVPNVLPVAFYFGILGYFGLTLNPTTVIVGCLAFGIAVDDTIHYFARFRAEARAGVDERTAAVEALRAVGRPITVTSAGLCLGFLALTSADLRNTAEFGALTAATLAFAWLTDVLVSPAIAVGSGMAERARGGSGA